MNHDDIVISELGWNFAAIPGSLVDSCSFAHPRPESDLSQGKRSGTSSLSSLLGVSNFDLIYINNWSTSKTSINDVSIVMEVIVKKAKVTYTETNNSDRYENEHMCEHEITLHPILAEFLVLATLDNIENTNDNKNDTLESNKNNEEYYNKDKKLENDLCLGEGNAMKTFISCAHEGYLLRAPFEVSRLKKSDILETDKIAKENNAKEGHELLQIFASIFILDNDNNLDNDAGYEELDLKLIQSHIEGRIVTKGSIVAFDLPSFPFSCNRRSKDETGNSCAIFLDIEEIKIIDQNQNSDDDFIVTCNDEGSSSSSLSKANDSICRHRLFYRLGSFESYELIIRSPQDPQQQIASLQLDKANEIKHEINDKDAFVMSQNEIKSYECPGYNHLLKKLQDLAYIKDRRGTPSGILLTGCTGVGKTTLSKNLAKTLSLSNKEKYKLISHYISAKDLILSASSLSSNSTLLLQKILPLHVIQMLKDQQNYFRNQYSCSYGSNRSEESSILNIENDGKQRQTQHELMYRFLLIIDDIDVLLEDNEETTGANIRSDQECSLSLHAITNAIDTLIAMDQETIKIVNDATVSEININDSNHLNHTFPPPPFILGICGSESSHFLGELVKVGRFEQVIEMPSPTQEQREIILTSLLKSILYSSSTPIHISPNRSHNENESIPNHDDVDYCNKIIEEWAKILAPQTVGCVASDLRRICADALIKATARHTASFLPSHATVQSLENTETNNDNDVSHTILRWDDIRESTRNCIPSQLAQIDVSITRFIDDYDVIGFDGSIDYKRRFDLAWERFSGYHTIKKRIYRSIVNPWIKYLDTKSGLPYHKDCSKSAMADKHKENDMKHSLDTSPPPGVLFHGPSGCGKTIAAGYLATSLGLHIIKIKASDILDQWLGGSEAAIRSVFARARSAAPCVIFFDEIDALATNREESAEHCSSDVHSRVLSTLLNEMDGISKKDSHEIATNILVVAATNRLNSIDAALLRPGRLQEHIPLLLPTKEDCLQILLQKIKGWNLAEDVFVKDLAEKLFHNGASGADIDGICREACLNSIRKWMESNPNDDDPTPIVNMEDFNIVLER